MSLKTVAAFFFAILIVIFSIQNSETTTVNVLFWEISMSRVLIILGSFGIGILVGLLAFIRNPFATHKK